MALFPVTSFDKYSFAVYRKRQAGAFNCSAMQFTLIYDDILFNVMMKRFNIKATTENIYTEGAVNL